MTVGRKMDIDNFFGNVPHSLIRDAALWFCQQFKERYPRRTTITMERCRSLRKYVSVNKVFKTSFKNYIRNPGIVDADKLEPRVQNNSVCSSSRVCLLIKHIPVVCAFDAKMGWTRFGSTLLR